MGDSIKKQLLDKILTADTTEKAEGAVRDYTNFEAAALDRDPKMLARSPEERKKKT